MTSDAAFVFQGTVVAVGAATLPSVSVDDLTAIVRVDQVLRAPEHLEQLVGREITVQLRKRAAAGDVAVFSADPWLYGDSLAVVEVGNRKSPPAAAVAGPRRPRVRPRPIAPHGTARRFRRGRTRHR